MSDAFAFSFFTPGGNFPSLLWHCAVKEMVIVLGTSVCYGKINDIFDYSGVC